MSVYRKSFKPWLAILTAVLSLLSAGRVSAANPFIASVESPVRVGARFNIGGRDFSSGAMVNFFVSTSLGAINQGPLKAVFVSPDKLSVDVPADVPLGQGVVAVQVVNADQDYGSSNVRTALLEGSASAGIPSISGLNGVPLAATSADPGYATDNVETVVPQGSEVTIEGDGFDTVNGVAVDVCCAGGKVGPFFINPGNPALTATSVTLSLPASGPEALPVGPASFVVSNKAEDGKYSRKSNAVSVPIGRRIQIISVREERNELIVDGTGFSTLTVTNFYDTQKGDVVNLGGVLPSGAKAIPITLVSDTEIRFAVPPGAEPGPAYVQALNPPFVPFTSTGHDPNGAFILVDTSASPTPLVTPTPAPTPAGSNPTPTPKPITPTPKSSGLPTATPTPKVAEAYGMLLAGGIDNLVTASGRHPVVASAEIYEERTGVFSPTGSMAYPRLGHSATVLNNRTILVAGGHNAYSDRAMPSAELYDIATRTFSFTGSMNSARLNHVAVLLNDGKVLVAGGQNVDFSAVDLAEIYDPATARFTPTASMLAPRIGAAAAVLKDGTVLIAGGADNTGLLASAELFDAKGAASVAVGSMSEARQGATATLLPNGTVLFAGGASQAPSCIGCATVTAEIYNPATKTFIRTGSMSVPRRGHTATLLPNGSVLIVGGVDDTNGAVEPDAEIYNPATRTFTRAVAMNSPRFDHIAAPLASGKVLSAGGFNAPNTITNTAEIYDPATGKFTPAATMMDTRAQQAIGCYSLTGGSADRSRTETISKR
jgi:hypothetical protein